MLFLCFSFSIPNRRRRTNDANCKTFLCRPYYETRANYNGILKNQKKRIVELELKVSSAKACYNDALKNLEQISEEIHKMREERRLSSDMVENYDVRKLACRRVWSLGDKPKTKIPFFRMTNASILRPTNIWISHQS